MFLAQYGPNTIFAKAPEQCVGNILGIWKDNMCVHSFLPKCIWYSFIPNQKCGIKDEQWMSCELECLHHMDVCIHRDALILSPLIVESGHPQNLFWSAWILGEEANKSCLLTTPCQLIYCCELLAVQLKTDVYLSDQPSVLFFLILGLYNYIETLLIYPPYFGPDS